MAVDIIVVYDTQPMYLISATLVTGDHVSVVFAGGLVHAATTETAVVRHRATFGKEFGFFFLLLFFPKNLTSKRERGRTIYEYGRGQKKIFQ